MEAGLFALAGVIVGGVLNGLVAWVLARHTARSNARVAALLVYEELLPSVAALIGLRERKTWGWLKAAQDFGCREVWLENRAILGHALDSDSYMALAAGYTGSGYRFTFRSRRDNLGCRGQDVGDDFSHHQPGLVVSGVPAASAELVASIG